MMDHLRLRNDTIDAPLLTGTACFLKRFQGPFLYCDDLCAGYFGTTVSVLVGRTVEAVFPKTLSNRFDALDDVTLTQDVAVLNLFQGDGLEGAFTISQRVAYHQDGEPVLIGQVSPLSPRAISETVGGWDWDIINDELVWSDTAASILGLTGEQSGFNFRQYLDCVHSDDRQRVLAAVSACLYRNKSYSLEHRVVTSTGDLRRVVVSAEMDRGENGRPKRMLGTIRTAEKEERAVDALSLTPGLMDHLPEAVFWVDPKSYEILDANKRACLYLDASRGHLLGSDIRRIIRGDLLGRSKDEEVSASLESSRLFESDLTKSDGSLLPVEVNAKLIHQRGEDRILVVVRNITHRKDLETSLSDSEKFRLDLLRDIPQLVARWTRAKKLIYANDAFCDVFASSLDDLLGRGIEEFVWESELPCLEAAVSDLNSLSPVVDVELRDAGSLEGDRRYGWRIRRLENEEGEFVGFQSIATDITQEKTSHGRASLGNERLRFAFQDARDEPALMCTREEDASLDTGGLQEFAPNKRNSLSDWERLLHDEDRRILNQKIAERSSRRAQFPDSSQAEQTVASVLANDRYFRLFNNSVDAILIHTLEGEVLELNHKACELLGLDPAEDTRIRMMDLPGKRELLAFRLAFEELRTEGRVEFESRINTAKGRLMSVDISSSLIHFENGTQVQTLIRDITERKVTESRMALSAQVFESTNEAVLITDNNGDIVSVNKSFSRIYQYGALEVLGANPRMFRSGRQGKEFYEKMWASLKKDGLWQGELWNCRKSGEEFPVWETINAVKDGDGNVSHYVAIVSDISSVKRSQEEIDYLAYHDSLTGLPNRLLFNEQVKHALLRSKREGERLAVMFMDLDRFKNINDTLGHPVGDEVLRQASTRLKQTLREQDVIARIGGDEFILLLENIHEHAAAGSIAQKLLDCFSRPFHVADQDLYLSSSIGISIYPEDGEDVSSLVKNADTAMYQAKARGRNGYRYYTEDLAIDPVEHLYLETGLRQALGRGELDVYYQPQIALDTGRIIGAEALVRWRHPEKGLMTPEHFIPLAEETGLIIPIGNWVLTEACSQVKRWHEQGLNLRRVAVNLSTIQVQRGDIVSNVAQVLKKTKLDPSILELEITENFILEDIEHSVSVLEGLRDLGVNLAIDDFGTGYSNLSYLKRLPVNKLKIDKSFVSDMEVNANDEDIVKAVIALGKSLQMKLVAEGVEKEQHIHFLMAEGCHEGQGYLYSRPVPAEEFPKLYRHYTEPEIPDLYPLDPRGHFLSQ